MGRYLLRRLLLGAPTLLFVTALAFAALRLAPGDPLSGAGELRGGAAAGREQVALLRSELGLDRPWLEAYGRWVGRLLSGELGTSFRTGRPVAESVAARLPVTVGLGAAAMALVYLLGIPLGLVAALGARRGGAGNLVDRLVSGGLFALYAIPVFWAGTVLLLFLGGGNYLDLIPVRGLASPGSSDWPLPRRLLDLVHHAAAPVALLAYGSLASVARQLRAAGLASLDEEHVRAARARGLPERSVLLRHAFRGALLPVVSHAGLMVPFLVGGSVIVERIFGIPGIGDLLYSALLHRDQAVILGVVAVASLVTLVGVILVDLLYAAVDPRVAPERR